MANGSPFSNVYLIPLFAFPNNMKYSFLSGASGK
jgi:hypothetical protein